MGAPPAYTPSPYSTRTIEAAPIRESLTRSPPPQPSRKLWAALLVLLGAIGAVVAFMSLRDSSAEVAPIPLPVETPTPTVLMDSVEARVNPCRRANLPFDPRATRFDCPVCLGQPGPVPAPRRWQMRLNGVTGSTLQPTSTMKVCAQVDTKGPVACASFGALPDFTGVTPRLAVTTADIDNGRVYFSIRDGSTILAKGFGHRKPGTTRYLETALCAGFVLVIDDPLTTISVFLDER